MEDQINANALKHYVYLHKHPELSFHEYETSAYIRQVLDQCQIDYEPVRTTGTIALIKGRDTSRTLALRADIDALPISETAGHLCTSEHEGIMHACGHDLHTACLLATAEYLSVHRHTLPTNIMLIFQHAEETLPGGAADIIAHPLFHKHMPEWIIALHAEPDLPTGSVGLHSGQYMASGDEVYITLRGPGGHAAFPERTTDLVLTASHIIIGLQQIASRNASPFLPMVLTFGNIRCHSTMNVIPQEITLEGTFRTFDEIWRKQAKERIRQISQSIAEGMGAQCSVNIKEGYPCLFNAPKQTDKAKQILQNILGKTQVVSLAQRMTTEDFARYSHILPATFIRLGVKPTHSACGKLHTPEFHPDTEAIYVGIKILCTFATSSGNI